MLGDRYQVVYLTGCQPECRQEAKNGQWENGFYTETLQQQITHGVTEEERQRVCNALPLTNLCGRLHKATEGQNGSCYVDYPVSPKRTIGTVPSAPCRISGWHRCPLWL